MNLRNWFGASSKNTPYTRFHRAASNRTPRCRLAMQLLEDRVTPATITVTSALDDGSSGTLRAAIAVANIDATNGVSDSIEFDSNLAGATIVLGQGQIELSGAGSGTITIDGSGLNTPITISGNHASRVFLVDGGVQAEFDSLIITQGELDSDAGGGIANAGTLTVNNCTLVDNSASSGGGINSGGSLMVSDCIITGNRAIGGSGGGISAATQATMSNSTFSGNSAYGAGGGIFFGRGTLSMTGCTISGNTASWGGAGGIAIGNAVATITNCTFSSNDGHTYHDFIPFGDDVSTNEGGASTVVIVDSTLSSPHPISYAWGGDGAGTISFYASNDTFAQAAVTAFNSTFFRYYYDDDSSEVPVPFTLTLNLANGSYQDLNFSLQEPHWIETVIVNGVNGTTVVGHSPALTVTAGNVIVNNVSFTTATDSPTILVTDGNLTLRNDSIQESTGFAAAAISVTGGTVDLGTTADPGGNILNVSGTGYLIDNTGPATITAVGNTFEQNAVVLTSPFRIQDLIVSSVNAGGGGLVTFGPEDAVYVSQTGDLQRGVDAVAAGGTVYVEAGHYGGIYSVGSKLLTIDFQGGPTVALRADPLAPELTDLVVSGTAGADSIKFNAGGTAYSIEADVGQWPKGRFSPTGRLVAYGGAGDDDIQIAGNISLPAWLYGEAGNDRLKGGASNDVLLGGPGDDFLAGDSGRDLMIGGIGADRILGNAGDDILIAGTTDFDTNEAALALIMQEWTRIDATFATRVSQLQAGGGSNAGYLLTDGTVHDDHTADVLTGAEGNDWFLFNQDGDGGVDKATDLSTFESLYSEDIDWLSH